MKTAITATALLLLTSCARFNPSAMAPYFTQPCHECGECLVLLNGYHTGAGRFRQHLTCRSRCVYIVVDYDWHGDVMYFMPEDTWSAIDWEMCLRWFVKHMDKVANKGELM